MKHFRFLFFLGVTLILLLCFTACDFSFMGGLMTPTTAPVTTEGAVTTTDPSTTTAPVTTTVPVTTTAPIEISQNPIKSVSLTTDGAKLVIKYQNNVTQNLLTDVAVREGFGSASLLDFDFDTNTRVVSLTYQASSALNRAELILGNEGEGPITLYLREMNGKLEYSKNGTSDWAAFADANRSSSVSGTPILTKLLELAEYGKQEISSMGNGVVFTIKQETEANKTQNPYNPTVTRGAYLRFRATEWQRAGYHYATDARLHGSANLNFNITNDYEIAANTPTDTVTGGTLFKYSDDDIKPPNFNGTAIGANHGYYIIAAIPNTMGLTEEDIGSVWQMGPKKFVLVKLHTGSAWFCPFDDQMMESGVFSYIAIKQGSTLTHVSGALHTSAITASADSVQTQFYNATNHVTQRAYLDGKIEIDLSKDGVYECEFIDFHETYDIIYTPAVLRYLMDNVGYNDNQSHCSDDIKEAYMTMDVTYRFHKNGAMVVYNEYICHKDLLIQSISAVQSCKMTANPQYVYVPGTTVAKTPIEQHSGVSIEWGTSSDLVDPTYPPTTYFQLTSPTGATAMNTGFYPLYGDARPEVRLSFPAHKLSAGWCHSTLKMYPLILRSNEGIPTAAGTHFSLIGYRAPSIATDEDMLAVNHYWVGDEIMLSLHTLKALDGKEIALPDYMNGMTVTLIEKSESMTVETAVIENGKITFSTTENGYAIVKLSPAP